jgi:hypothetical protein
MSAGGRKRTKPMVRTSGIFTDLNPNCTCDRCVSLRCNDIPTPKKYIIDFNRVTGVPQERANYEAIAPTEDVLFDVPDPIKAEDAWWSGSSPDPIGSSSRPLFSDYELERISRQFGDAATQAHRIQRIVDERLRRIQSSPRTSVCSRCGHLK